NVSTVSGLKRTALMSAFDPKQTWVHWRCSFVGRSAGSALLRAGSLYCICSGSTDDAPGRLHNQSPVHSRFKKFDIAWNHGGNSLANGRRKCAGLPIILEVSKRPPHRWPPRASLSLTFAVLARGGICGGASSSHLLAVPPHGRLEWSR